MNFNVLPASSVVAITANVFVVVGIVMDPGKMETQIGQPIALTNPMKMSRNAVLPVVIILVIVLNLNLLQQLPILVQQQLMELSNGNVLMEFVSPSHIDVTELTNIGALIVRIHQMKLKVSAVLNLVNTHGGKIQTAQGLALVVKMYCDLNQQ